ncbi:ATP-binding protein [Streptomyces sp. 4N509B]|uniref:ATP-binding protein n=1 Tax=Streptomyces sp. 4N509B TaxID=3457413 RepID=UPI003FD60290
MFESVLVANRGEIAVRVIRTLRRLGVLAIAVHSEADAAARHVREADVAVRVESYLSVEHLLDAARRTGARAVHPGYGFLAENAAFARAVTEAGLTFVGPPAAAIELMGDKIRAKETVTAAGVATVPGAHGEGGEELADAALRLGAPLLIKPSAGGGGKGMRLLRDAAALEPEALAEQLAAARREARAAFGDDTLLLERWIEQPRHIEVQILADAHGGVVHLGERECSLQRRHQKIVEEAPSPLLDEATRAALGEAAVRAARACGYEGAGTVEFVVPGGLEVPPGGARPGEPPGMFLEMNTRLQVEHPVTEFVTGLDLVEWQLRVAAGEPLPFGQADVVVRGHAVEARICAESQRGEDFLPSAGTVRLLREPVGEGVRVDSGLVEGTEVGTAYDPLLAKVVAYGPDRATALRRLRAALAHTTVLGVETNAAFLRRLLARPEVAAGRLDTGLVARVASELPPEEVPEAAYVAAALLRQEEAAPAHAGWSDPFAAPTGWRLGGEPAWTPHHLRAAGREPVTVFVREPPGRTAGGAWEVRVGEAGTPAPARLGRPDGATVLLERDGASHAFAYAAEPGGHWLGREGAAWHLRDHDPVAARAQHVAGVDTLTAPMPGTVTVVKVASGEEVAAGQSLLVVEAMKMEHVIAAPHAGVVTELDVRVGATVAMDQLLAVVTPQASSSQEGSDDSPS